MNNTIIAFISPEIELELRNEIAEILRIHRISLTDNVNKATVVIHTTEQIFDSGMTPTKLIEKIAQQPKTHVFELPKNFDDSIPPVIEKQPVFPAKKRNTKFIQNHTNRYKRTKQRKQTRFLTRTKHK